MNRLVGHLPAACVIVACALSGQSARATCGDWLAHPVQEETELAGQSEHQKATPEDAGKHAAGPARLQTPGGPCEGPLCRKAPTSAPQQSAGYVVIQKESRVGMVALVDSRDPDASPRRFSFELVAKASRGFPSRTDRPPRV